MDIIIVEDIQKKAVVEAIRNNLIEISVKTDTDSKCDNLIYVQTLFDVLLNANGKPHDTGEVDIYFQEINYIKKSIVIKGYYKGAKQAFERFVSNNSFYVSLRIYKDNMINSCSYYKPLVNAFRDLINIELESVIENIYTSIEVYCKEIYNYRGNKVLQKLDDELKNSYLRDYNGYKSFINQCNSTLNKIRIQRNYQLHGAGNSLMIHEVYNCLDTVLLVFFILYMDKNLYNITISESIDKYLNRVKDEYKDLS